jgi:uncharacterized lipoprotein YajG
LNFAPGAGLLFSYFRINHETIQLIKKMFTMKKLLVVLAIGAFAACNNSASTEAKTDTTAAKVDSSAMKVDSSAAKVDSSAKKVDSAAKKVDSSAKK